MENIVREKYNAYLMDINELKDQQRIWFVFSHIHKNTDEEKIITDILDDIGVKMEYEKSIGASIYLYNLNNDQYSLTFYSYIEPKF